ncbi:MAG: histidinol-phosphatase [Lachnospiraceae bacterium]|nr:histidinol-phosphatase [Lachnospiraceae bacterium]
MLANYHTHTFRCHHAKGEDEDYVRAALDNGIRILGFSDHAPMLGRDYLKADIRMRPELLSDYVHCIRKLRETYADQLEIHIGLEVEYYPDIFRDLTEFYKRNGVEYLILGQHWIGKESVPGESCYMFRPTDSEANLSWFADTLIEAMESERFTYVAHPDIIQYTGPDEIFEKYMRKIARRAKELGIPAEINLHGLRGSRNYPDPRFLRIAAEEGTPCIIGYDAHDPHEFYEHENYEAGLALARNSGVKLLETAELVRL